MKLDNVFAAVSSEIQPSDLGQSVVRLFIVAAVLIWSAVHPIEKLGSELIVAPNVALTFVYLIYAACLHLLWKTILSQWRTNVFAVKIVRLLCLISDIAAISAYTAVSEQYAYVLLPFYLTAIIGYGFRFSVFGFRFSVFGFRFSVFGFRFSVFGFRFGNRYMFATLIASLIGFSFACQFNTTLARNETIQLTYYLSMLFVPIYSSALLFKYQEVLELLETTTMERNRFIATLSHEFRAPLSSILSLADVVRSRITQDQLYGSRYGDLNENVRTITTCAERLLSVTNRIAGTTESNSTDTRSIDEQRFNTYFDIRTSIDICRIHAWQKRIPLYWRIDNQVPFVTTAASTLVQEILIVRLQTNGTDVLSG